MDTMMVSLTVTVEAIDGELFMARLPDQFQMHPGYGATPERAVYDLLNPQDVVVLRQQATALAGWLTATYASLPDTNSYPSNVSVFRRIIRNSNPEGGET